MNSLTGILIAMPAEARAVLGRRGWQRQDGRLVRRSGSGERMESVCVCSGIGAERAEAACRWLIARGATSLLLLGVAGGLHPGLRSGDLVVADGAVETDVSDHSPLNLPGYRPAHGRKHTSQTDALHLQHPAIAYRMGDQPTLGNLEKTPKPRREGTRKQRVAQRGPSAERLFARSTNPGGSSRDGLQTDDQEAGDFLPADGNQAREAYAALVAAGLPARLGRIVTVSRPVRSPAAKAGLYNRYRALTVDMESAAVLRTARVAGLPARILRAVCDPAARCLPEAVAAGVAANGRRRPVYILRQLAADPVLLLPLWQANKDMAAALLSLKRAWKVQIGAGSSLAGDHCARDWKGVAEVDG